MAPCGRKHTPRIRPVAAATIVLLLVSPLGCAVAPPPSKGSRDLPEASIHALEALIVNLDPDAQLLVVKQAQTYETWTVSLLPTSSIRTVQGDYARFDDLWIGARIGIRGASRLANHISAYEIELREPIPDAEGQSRPSPRW